MIKLLIGYKQASDYTGIPVRRLQRMVERRTIRVVKESKTRVYFFPDHLSEDLEAMERPKI